MTGDFRLIDYIFNLFLAEHVSESERGAERAKYSRSAEQVFIQRPERSLCLAPVSAPITAHTTSLGHAQIHPELTRAFNN